MTANDSYGQPWECVLPRRGLKKGEAAWNGSSGFASRELLDFDAAAGAPPTVSSHRELLAAFASSTEQARCYLATLNDERATATWRLVAGGRELFAASRAAVLRSLLFNHWYHHRGQLVVYLRLLNVPVPSVYGPTADENPFADA